MDTSPLATTGAMRLAVALPLLAEVALFTASAGWEPRWLVRGAFLAVCAVTLAVSVGWARRGPGRWPVATIAAVSAVALPSSIMYLASLDPDGADIPLAGGGVFLVANGLLLSALVAAGRTDRPVPVSR